MAHIKSLHDSFTSINITDDNFSLWQKLLDVDISDYKPLMEKLLSGELDIEDTRPLLENIVTTSYESLNKESRLSKDLNQTIKSNLTARLFADGEVIKENALFIHNKDDYKEAIAQKYFEKTGNFLSESAKAKILVIIEEQIIQELNMSNYAGYEDPKAIQLRYSDMMSVKPIAEI